VTISTSDGTTALHFLVRFKFDSIPEIEKLQRVWEIMKTKGASLNAKGRLGEAPLHQAVSRNNMQAVKWLLSSGAEINAANKYAWPIGWCWPHHVCQRVWCVCVCVCVSYSRTTRMMATAHV
jgi:ankyrin repeat protein